MQEATTTQTRRRALGWIAVGSITGLLMLGSTGAAVLGAGHGTDLLQATPISSDDVDFQGDEEECAGTPAGSVVWHFVLTQTADASGTLNATFENAGPVSETSDFRAGKTLHWFITTGAPDTLLSAMTTSLGGNLVLSHICNGGETTTTTTTTTETTTTDTGTTTTN